MARPSETLREVFAFLGEPYDGSILEPETSTTDAGAPDRGRIFESSIGRWRRDLTPHQLERVMRVAGDRLAELDYLD